MQKKHFLKGTAALTMLACWHATAGAQETFICDDGSTVFIDDDNRAELKDHPCVKAWFAGESGRAGASAATAPEQLPVVHRYGQRRAAAQRELRERAAYLARSRTNATQPSEGIVAQPTTTPRGPVAKAAATGKLGVIIKLPPSRDP